MLEITGKDIEQLRDDDLRTLIGLLCEAELRSVKLPVAGVTWGGHQDASDGGIDVRVDLEVPIIGNGFIPRAKTGWQVKKSDLPRKKILTEMQTKGKLKETIKNLVKDGGAYIIASGNSSTTDKTLSNRKNAIREALDGLAEKENLFIDFYDQNRIASWTRCHPSMILWVRKKIGNPLLGWQPFRNWSKSNEDTDEEYFIDNEVRLYEGNTTQDNGESIVQGINRLRNKISNTSDAVRIVGLSGVGKTRLLQALFDDRIGQNVLSRNEVIYADGREGVSPGPIVFAQQLMALRQSVILAIDNCTPNLHQELTKICCLPGSKVKLITIEYDVKDDEIEKTKVFRLEPSSISLIEKIIHKQFSFINSNNARTIAELSGGNARIAFAVAKTITKGDSSVFLKENDLFNRLFHQRNIEDKSLLKAGEICSLVYSFNFERDEDDFDEMDFLSKLAEKTKTDLHADIVELKRRDLVQQRSKWRAILPHAIANRLAARGLDNIPFDILITAFEGSSERLLKSFSNRLSFLHGHEVAEKVAQRWLSEDGLLGELHNLKSFGWDVFKKIASVSPSATLGAIERAIKHDAGNGSFIKDRVKDYSTMISLIAYEGQYFERSVNVLKSMYYLDSSKEDREEWIKPLIETLFQIKYSRTHATLKNRISVAEKYLTSNDKEEQDLGLLMLNGLLASTNMRPFYGYSRLSRKIVDFGYSPKTNDEVNGWYATVIKLCDRYVGVSGLVGEKVQDTLAKSFKGLWSLARWGFYKELEEVARKIAKNKMWVEGWLATRKTLRGQRKVMEEGQLLRLCKLEKELQPETLIDKVRGYVFSTEIDFYALVEPLVDDDNIPWEESLKTIKELGEEVAKNKAVFKELLPEMIKAAYAHNSGQESFYEGLAMSCEDPIKMWHELRTAIISNSESKNVKILHYYLSGIWQRDPKLSDEFLDGALTDGFLIGYFPFLQGALPDDPERWNRLKKSFVLNRTPVESYSYLTDSYLQADFDAYVELLELLVKKEHGIPVAIKILYNSVFSKRSMKNKPPNANMKAFGRKLLAKLEFNSELRSIEHLDHKLETIIKGCFESNQSEEGKLFCDNLAKAYVERKFSFLGLKSTLVSLAKGQSICFLDSFLADEIDISGAMLVGLSHDSNPIFHIEKEVIESWCNENPDTRYPKVASSIVLLKSRENGKGLEFSDVALMLLDKAPSISNVLKGFEENFYPSLYTGSRLPYYEERLNFLERLKDGGNEDLIEWVRRMKVDVKAEIDQFLSMENESSGLKYERFED